MTKKPSVPERLRRQVQERAQGRCEYCLIHESDMYYTYTRSIASLAVSGQFANNIEGAQEPDYSTKHKQSFSRPLGK